MTFDVDMSAFREGGFGVPDLASPIMPELVVAAKQNTHGMESRRGQGCDICARCLWRVRNFHVWCTGS